MPRLIFFLLLMAGALAAQPAEQRVRRVLDEQAAAWNRGDIEAFMKGYAAETTFVGKEIARGSLSVLEGYRKRYPTKENMGMLRFSDLEIRPLGADYASVIGRYRLQRSAAGGGNASGVFTLLFQKKTDEWKIVLDHTSSDQ